VAILALHCLLVLAILKQVLEVNIVNMIITVSLFLIFYFVCLVYGKVFDNKDKEIVAAAYKKVTSIKYLSRLNNKP